MKQFKDVFIVLNEIFLAGDTMTESTKQQIQAFVGSTTMPKEWKLILKYALPK